MSIALVFSLVQLTVFLIRQQTSYYLLIRDWSSDVCSTDLSPSSMRARMDEGGAEDRGDRQHHPFVIAIGEEADQIPPMRAVVEVKGRAGAANLDHADENRQDDQRQEQPHASFPGAVVQKRRGEKGGIGRQEHAQREKRRRRRQAERVRLAFGADQGEKDRKSTRLNSSH